MAKSRWPTSKDCGKPLEKAFRFFFTSLFEELRGSFYQVALFQRMQ